MNRSLLILVVILGLAQLSQAQKLGADSNGGGLFITKQEKFSPSVHGEVFFNSQLTPSTRKMIEDFPHQICTVKKPVVVKYKGQKCTVQIIGYDFDTTQKIVTPSGFVEPVIIKMLNASTPACDLVFANLDHVDQTKLTQYVLNTKGPQSCYSQANSRNGLLSSALSEMLKATIKLSAAKRRDAANYSITANDGHDSSAQSGMSLHDDSKFMPSGNGPYGNLGFGGLDSSGGMGRGMQVVTPVGR